MKQLNVFWVALLATLVWTSCTNEQATELEQQIDGKRAIQVTLPEYESGDAETRTNFKPDNLSFSWADGDTLGIFSDQGDQVNFALSGGSGDKCATFTGGGWALKSGNKYYAYYPFSRQCYAGEHMKNEIPVSLQGQTQTGDNSTAHLGKYAYMYAEGSNSSNGKVSLTMKPLTVIMKLVLTLPVTGQVKSVSLSTSKEEFCTRGSFDLQSPASGITPSDGLKKEVTLACKNLQAYDKQPFTTYLLLTSTDLKQKEVTVTVSTQNNGAYSETFRPSQNWSAGKYYTKEISWVVYPLIVGKTSIDRSNGKVTAKTSIESGENISAQGFYYSIANSNPGRYDGIVSGCLISGNVIEADVSHLTPYIRYYIRAFATNDHETAVGEVTEFAVKTTVPAVTISAKGDASNYTLQGIIEADGGSPISEYGFYIGDAECEDVEMMKNRGRKVRTSGIFSYSEELPLGQNVKYVCSYATNEAGTAYSTIERLGATPLPPIEITGVPPTINLISIKYNGSTTPSDLPGMWGTVNYEVKYRVASGDKEAPVISAGFILSDESKREYQLDEDGCFEETFRNSGEPSFMKPIPETRFEQSGVSAYLIRAFATNKYGTSVYEFWVQECWIGGGVEPAPDDDLW